MGVQKVEACDLKDFKKSCCCAVLIQVWLFDFPDKSTGVSKQNRMFLNLP